MIRETLADIVVRGEFDDFGIFRFLNRVTCFSTKQVCYVILDRSYNINNTYTINRNVNLNDGIISDKLREYLNNEGYNTRVRVLFSAGDETEILQIKNYDNAYRIFDTEYYALLFHLETRHLSSGCEPEIWFSPISKGSAFGALFESVFQPFHINEDGLGTAVPGYLQNQISSLSEKSTIQAAIEDNPEKFPIRNDMGGQPNLIGEILGPISEMTDREYIRLSDSTVLRRKSIVDEEIIEDYGATNIIFIGKTFDSENIRYGRYFYQNQFFIGREQEKDIVRRAKNIRTDYYIEYLYGESRHQDRISELEKRVVKELSESPRSVLERVRTPAPSDVRLFIENAMRAGSSMIKPGVFKYGGIGWIERVESRQWVEVEDSYRYLISMHYALQLLWQGRPIEREETLSLVAYPFRCSGGIWMCAVYVRDNRALENEEILEEDYMHETFRIYHFLLKQTERRFRTRAREMFADELGRAIARGIASTIGRNPGRRPGGIDNDARGEIERHARLLARVYPFELLCLKKRNGEGWGQEDVVDLAEVEYDIAANPFFDRLTLHSFLKEEKVARYIDRRIAYEFLSIER